MNTPHLNHVVKISTENTGGGCYVDFVTLHDGRVLGINEDCVVLYASIEDYYENNTEYQVINLVEVD